MAFLLEDEEQKIIDYLGLLSLSEEEETALFLVPQISFSPTDFADYHRFLLIFLVVSRKNRIFGGRIKCLKGEDYGNRY